MKLHKLRLQRNIKQSDAARDLGVSAAYLNLIEKGKRVMLLPRCCGRRCATSTRTPRSSWRRWARAARDKALAKLLDEPLLKTLDIDPESLQSLSAEPKLAGTVAALFNLYKNTRTQLLER